MEGTSLGLVITGIVTLPFSLVVAFLSQLTMLIASDADPRSVERGLRVVSRPNQDHSYQGCTILVTGLSMAKSLTLARAFHLCGYRVIGADFEGSCIPCPGRYSKALSRFWPLASRAASGGATSYAEQLVKIVKTERVDLWVSCSGVASAVEDARAKELIEHQTPCTCVQLDIETTSKLHEKSSFIRHIRSLGLLAPETHDVTSAEDVLRILSGSVSLEPERKFILKPVGVDDAHRGDMTLFPLGSPSETRTYVHGLPISHTKPWILQEFIPGGEEYCTHALVVRGEVRVFVACPSAELLMHYRALPATSALSRSFLSFTRQLIARSPGSELWTGHLSFDFMVAEGKADENRFEKRIYAIECNPRAHTATVLFSQYGPEMTAMVNAYISALRAGSTSGSDRCELLAISDDAGDQLVVPPVETPPRYWLGHDLVVLILHRACLLLIGRASLKELVAGCVTFAAHVYEWKEGTFATWDPWPAVILYHVYWPMSILSVWWQGDRWSRLNVSTTKMFGM